MTNFRTSQYIPRAYLLSYRIARFRKQKKYIYTCIYKFEESFVRPVLENYERISQHQVRMSCSEVFLLKYITESVKRERPLLFSPN
jgi:hypothetical protein